MVETDKSKLKINLHDVKKHRWALLASKKEIAHGVFWLLVIVLVIWAGAKFIGLEDIQQKVAAAGALGPLVLILLKASTLVFAPLGGNPLYLVAAPLFGFWSGLIYAILGDLLGITLSFYISRLFGRKVMGYFLSKKGRQMVDDILYHISTWKGLFIGRIIFFGFPEGINYAAGLARVPFMRFLVVTLIFIIPGDMIMVGFGQALLENFNSTVIILTIGGLLATLGTVLGVSWYHKKVTKAKKDSMIKAIIFDLNGVFIKSRFLSDRFEERYGVSGDEFLAKMKGVMDKVRLPEAGQAWQYWQPLMKEWGVKISEQEFWDFWFKGEKEAPEMIQLAQEIKSKGVQLFILSNNFSERAKYYEENFRFLSEICDKLYYSWQTGQVKPSQQAYTNLLEENDIKPEECLYFDDSKKNVEVANSLGINSYIFEGAEQTRKVFSKHGLF